MELSPAARPFCLHGHFTPRRSLSDFAFNHERLFSPYDCHRLPPGNVFRITLCIRSFRPTLNSMLTRKGHSIPNSEGSCDIVWILETDLDTSQLLLYITGDLPVLGGWQPKKAIQMLPTEDTRLWKAEVKTPSGVNFKYKYFVVDKTRASCDISWRRGPKYSLSVPLNDEEDRRILVRDSWMKQGLQRSLAHVWGLWTEEMHLVEPSISCHPQDRNEIAEVLELGEPGQLKSDLNVQASPVLNDEIRLGARYEGADLVLSDRDRPVEEPWLPTIFISSENEKITELAGHSIPKSEGLCDIVWILETDLDVSQLLLYITGDLPVLGGWQPKMAVQMLPTEDARLWKAEVKTPSDVNFKYNYFVVDKTRASCDISWRRGPKYSLSVPLNDVEDRIILVRDSWMKQGLQRSLTHIWGLWTEEMHLVEPSISCHAQERNEISEILELEEPGQLKSDLNVQASLVLDDEVRFGARYEEADLVLCDRDQPMEEPWLPTVISSKNEKFTELAGEVDFVKDVVVSLSVDNQDSLGKDRSVHVKENNQILKDHTPSTIILINSSKCTMQRIAVLEDGKLVELLLEPVNIDVLCDSIYLGVVIQLAPGLEGAFVDIGPWISTFMEIKHHIKPFVMEPQKTMEQEVDDSFLKIFEELQSRVQVTDESVKSAKIMSDDREDHGDDDDLKCPSEHTNGSALDYEEVNSGQYIVNLIKCIPEGAISSSPTVNPEKSDASHVPNRHNREDLEVMLVRKNKWENIHEGSMIIVQVVKEGLGTKAPMVTPYPRLRSRFWILLTRSDKIEVSQKITGEERKRLEDIAKGLQPPDFGLEVRTLAAGHSSEELKEDLKGLLMTWKNIVETASAAARAADLGTEGAVPVMLHKAMGQTLSVVQDYFSEKVKKVVIDSPRTYSEVMHYLRYYAPDLCDRVELYNKRNPLFSEYKIEEEINYILIKRVPLDNGGSLVIEHTEALVSIDVNGGHMMIGHGISQEKASLDVNIAAAKQIARELRLRDIGGIIVVDFIDMGNEANKRLVYQEMKRAVMRDGSNSFVKVSELSECGLMEITRQRVRPSVPFMISEPCTCCHGTGRVESLEMTLSKIEQEICRLLASRDQVADPENPKTWPKFRLWVDHHMFQYLTSGERTRLAILSSSFKIWLILKVDRGLSRGSFKLRPFNDGTESDDIKSQSLRLQALLQPKDGSANPQRKAALVAVKKAKTRRKKAKTSWKKAETCREAKELFDMALLQPRHRSANPQRQAALVAVKKAKTRRKKAKTSWKKAKTCREAKELFDMVSDR